MNKTEFYNKHNISIEKGERKDIFNLFSIPKTSKTLEALKSAETIEKPTSQANKFSLKSLSTQKPTETEENQQLPSTSTISDYYGTAKLLLRLTNWGVRFGLNFYLENKGLSVVTKEELQLDKGAEKMAIHSVAEVLFKYNTKIGVEMNAVLTLGGVYFDLISGLVDKKKLEKLERENKILRDELKKQKTKKEVKKEVGKEVEKEVEQPYVLNTENRKRKFKKYHKTEK